MRRSGRPAAACHASRSSPRRSARSGRRSGTSRRSTTSPPRPPATSIAKWRPRVPRRTVSRKRNSATADVARRQVDEGQAARRSGRARSSRPCRGSRRSRRSARCACRPASRPCPSGASRSSTRSATIARRSSGSGIDPSGASSRAWSSANWPAPGRRRTSTRASATIGAGATAHAPPAATTRSAGGRSSQSGVALGEPAEGGAGGGHPERRAVAGRVGPRRDAQLAQPVAQAVPVGAPGGPRPDPIHDRVVRIGRARGRASGTTARSDGRRPAADAGRRGRPGAGVVADLDDVDAPVEDLRQRHGAPVRARDAQSSGGRASSSRSSASGPPGDAAPAPPARARPRRAAGRRRRTPPDGRSSRRPGSTASSGRRVGHGRDERGHLAQRAPFVGGRRVAGPDQHAPDARLEEERSTSPAGRSPRRSPRSSASRSARRSPTSGPSARSEAAMTARRRGGWLATSRRGRSTAPPRRQAEALGEGRIGLDQLGRRGPR